MSGACRTVILGAGALGLGFIGPLTAPAGEVHFLDVSEKASLLGELCRRGRYVYNQAAGDEVRTIDVGNVRASLATSAVAVDALVACDCCFTAVGEINLEGIAPLLRESARRRKTPLPVLCAENGTHVSHRLARFIGLDENVRTGDTAMGRMCRWMDEVEEGYTPLYDGTTAGIVTDDFVTIPVRLSGAKVPPEYVALRPLGERAFALYEHMKLFGHNCLHALFAYSAARAGLNRIRDTGSSPEVAARARRMLFEELEPALKYHYRETYGAEVFRTYVDSVMDRILSKGFNDTVARGIRGARQKLLPAERWVHAIRFVRAAGVYPNAYLEVMAEVISVSGLLDTMSLEEILADHCELDPEETAVALEVMERLLILQR